MSNPTISQYVTKLPEPHISQRRADELACCIIFCQVNFNYGPISQVKICWKGFYNLSLDLTFWCNCWTQRIHRDLLRPMGKTILLEWADFATRFSVFKFRRTQAFTLIFGWHCWKCFAPPQSNRRLVSFSHLLQLEKTIHSDVQLKEETGFVHKCEKVEH